MLTMPNIESAPTFDGQAVPDSTDWAAQSISESGTGILSGMTVVPLGTPAMAASVNAGVYIVNGAAFTYAGGSVAVTAASVSDRRDIVSAAASSVITVTAGVPCGTALWTRNSTGLPPYKPAIPSNNVLLGEIYVASTTTSVASGNLVDKTTMTGGAPGALLARAQLAPSTAGSIAVINITTGITALDTTNLKVSFAVPPSGNVFVHLQAFISGPAVIASKVIYGVVSTTSSPGTLVGVSGLVYTSPTALVAENQALVDMDQIITGLTVGSTLTWYFGAAFSGTLAHIVPQGVTGNTTVPSGAPALIEIFSA